MALLDRIGAGVTLRRAASRVRSGPEQRAAGRPLGVKLELTFHCNLRCGFCYTDSPRQTLARTPDLDHEAWRRIVDEAIELGIIEAVVTGGEPLLQRELALELLERLDGAGVGVTLNTNGWFVDEAVADRLAALRGLTTQVSIDGASAAAHDRARGVPGSWRRAVRAVGLLLERGVRVHVPYVVTPDNQEHTAAFLELMWALGVPQVRLAPVIQIGAAARSGRWRVSRRPLDVLARDFERSHGGRMAVCVLNPAAAVAPLGDKVPASILVRPDGTARMESLNPFAFGNAARDGLAVCWERMARGWSDPQIQSWGSGLRDKDLHQAALVPYRDPDVDLTVTDGPNGMGNGGDPPVLPRMAEPPPGDPAADREYVRGLALERRYRLGPVRFGSRTDGSRLVRVTDARRVVCLNRTGALVMDWCADGTVGDVVERFAATYPDVPRARLEDDVLAALRDLAERGVLRPALARGRTPALPAYPPADGLDSL